MRAKKNSLLTGIPELNPNWHTEGLLTHNTKHFHDPEWETFSIFFQRNWEKSRTRPQNGYGVITEGGGTGTTPICSYIPPPADSLLAHTPATGREERCWITSAKQEKKDGGCWEPGPKPIPRGEGRENGSHCHCLIVVNSRRHRSYEWKMIFLSIKGSVLPTNKFTIRIQLLSWPKYFKVTSLLNEWQGHQMTSPVNHLCQLKQNGDLSLVPDRTIKTCSELNCCFGSPILTPPTPSTCHLPRSPPFPHQSVLKLQNILCHQPVMLPPLS